MKGCAFQAAFFCSMKENDTDYLRAIDQKINSDYEKTPMVTGFFWTRTKKAGDMLSYSAVFWSVTNKGWKDTQFRNILNCFKSIIKGRVSYRRNPS